MSIEDIFAGMEWAAKHGLWDMITALLAVGAFFIGVGSFFGLNAVCAV